jgi:hypothetical protein
MPPQKKRQRNTTLANLPRDILEKIHTNLYKRSLRDSRTFAQSFKRAREAIPMTRPNRITNAERKLQLPPEVLLPGPGEVRELKQRLLFVTKLLRELQRDVKNHTYTTRKQRYSAFANTLKHVLETNPSLDTIQKRHLKTEYTLPDWSCITSMHAFRHLQEDRRLCGQDITLHLYSSEKVLPFEVRLFVDDLSSPISSSDTDEISFKKALLTVKVGQWGWEMVGSTSTWGDANLAAIDLPMSVRRIRVNRQTGIIHTLEIRHQQDTIDLVRLIRLMTSTDPNARWRPRLARYNTRNYLESHRVFHRVVDMHALPGRIRNNSNSNHNWNSNNNTYVSNSNRN